MSKKIVYIAHPIGAETKEGIEDNLSDLIRILRVINTNTHTSRIPPFHISADEHFEFENIIPIAPYYADILALDDANPLERKRGIENDIALIQTGVFDELWLTGDKISLGMREEINLFRLLGKPIIDYTGKI